MIFHFDGLVAIFAMIIGLALLFFLKKKKRYSNSYILIFAIFYLYLCLLLNHTQFPIMYQPELADYSLIVNSINYIPFSGLYFKHFLLNIVLTIPFGFLLPFIYKVEFSKKLFWAVMLPIIIEGLQLFILLLTGIPLRAVDINDIIANFIGILIGYFVFRSFIILFRKLTQKEHDDDHPFIRFIRQY
ncbi:VanZ family protein [Amphibacillus sediminis]|uniref:VanZ family protein n=1 Tax=Amphibacillus sediminis TaxID=360185 RepID=UPI000833FB0B|nr:VanZ family protein [Amphibacillus sediminis]